MALTAPSPQQKRFAGQLAWERGKKIARMPESSSALSGLIQSLLAADPLPIVAWQVDAFTEAVRECAAKVPNFDATDFAEVPTDRAAANKAIHALRRRLNAVEYREAQSNAASYLVDEDSPEAASVEATRLVENSRVEDADIPL